MVRRSSRSGRNAEGGLQKAIASGNNKVGLIAFNMDPFTLLFFTGRARLDPSQNDTVWENIPDGEKGQDPERKGGAIIIELDSIKGLGGDGNFFMAARDEHRTRFAGPRMRSGPASPARVARAALPRGVAPPWRGRPRIPSR